MAYLARLKVRPSEDTLSAADVRHLQTHFQPSAAEVEMSGQVVEWQRIEALEVARAARAAGPAGWLVRKLVYGEDRYHVGVYWADQEAVLPNLSLMAAKYVVEMIAYYAPTPVRYNGPGDLAPLVDSWNP
jgi:hypothetical protein